MQTSQSFWQDRKVFVTGHTGFKGAWLCLWLHRLGAKVFGYALDPPTQPNLFELCRIDELVTSICGDVCDSRALREALLQAEPEVVIHMAAQSLVRESYRDPVRTYATNIMGTVNLLEAVRGVPTVRAVVLVTSDKCYLNQEWFWGYRENEPLGGFDPYSSSKACAELVTAAYRNSFFSPSALDPSPCNLQPSPPAIATARAGNVIGGGDWGADRLVPDCVRSLLKGEKILIRNPAALRPWQHVLEPLSGYLLLAEKLYRDGPPFAEALNFGPDDADTKPVEWLVGKLCTLWGDGAGYELDARAHPHEAQHLKLDCSKARAKLGWRPRWNLEKALAAVISWTHDYRASRNMRTVSLAQIEEYALAAPSAEQQTR
jgi:CDP-glucose 4,6-dehydratase